MNKKYIALLLGFLILGTGILFFLDDKTNFIPLAEKKIVYNCDNIDVVYLKPSEKNLAGEVARNIKGIAVIPEENYMVADTEILMQCDNIDFSDYIKMESNSQLNSELQNSE